MTSQRRTSPLHFWLLWLPTFLGFPLGGLVTSLTVGPIQFPLEALIGGAITGAIIGLAQWLALRRLYRVSWLWVAASSLGMAVGLGLGVTLASTETGTSELVSRGLITGSGVGVAQALLWRKLVPFWLWTPAVSLLWALAWLITKLVITKNIENDFAVFGASGALCFTLLSGLVLRRAARPVPEVR